MDAINKVYRNDLGLSLSFSVEATIMSLKLMDIRTLIDNFKRMESEILSQILYKFCIKFLYYSFMKKPIHNPHNETDNR